MVYSGSMTTPVERGCGVRKEGGIYLECGMGASGMPLEWFIKDRPVLVDADALGLSAIGIKLIRDGNGVYHVLDIVGREGYPNWADFLEEVRRFGLSRRASTTTDFGLLTADSRIMLAHSRAYWENVAPYMAERVPRIGWDDPAIRRDGYYWEHCPKSPDPKSDPCWLDGPSFGNRHTINGAGFGETAAAFCSGLWWEDLGVPAEREETRPMYTDRYRDLRDTAVCMPSFTYYGRHRPRTALQPKSGGAPRYQLAIGLVMPITNLVVVDGEGAEEAIKRLEDRGMIVGINGDIDAAERSAERGKPPVFIVEE